MSTPSNRITAIEEQKRRPNRRSLFLDGQFALGLDAEVVALLGLRVGQVIDRATLLEAARAEELKRAKDEALVFLGFAARTRHQVEQKLQRRGYAPEIVAEVLELLERYQFIDDEAYARAYARERSRARQPRGRRRLVQELRQRGIAPEVIDEALPEALAGTDQAELATQAASERLRRLQSYDETTRRRRLYAYLQRQGFDYDAIRVAMARVLRGEADG